MIKRRLWRMFYILVYHLGVRAYSEPDGTVDWDGITLGNVLDDIWKRT